MRITRHPIAAGIQPAGDVDDHRIGVRRKPRFCQFIQHNGAGDNAAAHGRIFVGKGKIVVQLLDDFLRFCIVNLAASPALLRPCVNGLQHSLRHAGEFDLFSHIIFPPLA